MINEAGVIPVIDFYAYDEATGLIRWTGRLGEDKLALQSGGGIIAVEGSADPRTQYVDGGVLVDRPTLDVQDALLAVGGGEQSVAAGLPTGTAVSVDGADPEPLEDGEITVDPAEPMTLTLRLLPPFPYQAATITVTAS